MRIKKINKHTLLIVGAVIGFLLLTTGTLLMARNTANAPEGDHNTEQTNEEPEQRSVPEETGTPSQPTGSPTPPATGLNKKQHSTDEPSSLWMVVNKKRPLPSSYVPAGLTSIGGKQMRSEAATALSSMMSVASKANSSMTVISGYRSYTNQQNLYNGYVQRDGQVAADRYSARPGFSEHQTGLVADMGSPNGACALEICFENTAAGKWLATHAHEYGFIIRYVKEGEARTGYQYEPWHIRYVGKELAGEIYKANQTMEEYFGIPAASAY